MVLNIVEKLVERYTDGNITAVITKANFSTDVFFFILPKIWEHILSGTTLHGCF